MKNTRATEIDNEEGNKGLPKSKLNGEVEASAGGGGCGEVEAVLLKEGENDSESGEIAI